MRVSCSNFGLVVLPAVHHAFMHVDLQITPLRVRWDAVPGVREPDARVQGPALLWYNARQPARVGISAPIAVLLASLPEAAPAPPPEPAAISAPAAV